MKYKELLDLGSIMLKEKNKDIKDIKLLINYYKEINKIPKKRTFKKHIKKIIKGLPIQYIIGNVNFCGNLIKVNKNVLIPRFETEELTSLTKDIIKKKFNKKINILDIGCGSGAIAITLKKEFEDANTIGIDISNKALKLAKKNAKINNVNITFLQGNILSPLTNETFDVVISNPPYIAYSEKIEEIVLNNEPHIALFTSNNGLYFYEEILKNIKKHLKKEYLIAFEIGCNQKNRIIKLINIYLPNSIYITKKDLSKKDRFIFIMNKKE